MYPSDPRGTGYCSLAVPFPISLPLLEKVEPVPTTGGPTVKYPRGGTSLLKKSTLDEKIRLELTTF